MAWMKPQTTTRPYRNLRCPRFFARRMVEQQLLRNRPSIFRRMILVGTAPRGGEDIMHIDKPGPEFPRFSPESFPASGGPFMGGGQVPGARVEGSQPPACIWLLVRGKS